jgi:K+-sensing histidine kinase KdpD
LEKSFITFPHKLIWTSDILTLSKLDANLLTIAPDPVNPVSLVQKALKMYAAEVQAAGIEASLVADQSMKDLEIGEIVVDSGRLLQVLINLLVCYSIHKQHIFRLLIILDECHQIHEGSDSS